jgi:hypothetical protein
MATLKSVLQTLIHDQRPEARSRCARPSRIAAARNAMQWLCQDAMRLLLVGPEPGSDRAPELRALSTLRELAYASGLEDGGVYDERAFAAWQRRVAPALGMPLLAGTDADYSARWYTSPSGLYPVWQAVRAFADANAPSSAGFEPAFAAAHARHPHLDHLTQALRMRLGPILDAVLVEASGSASGIPELHLIVPDTLVVTPDVLARIATAWRELQRGEPHAPMILSWSMRALRQSLARPEQGSRWTAEDRPFAPPSPTTAASRALSS